MQTLSPSLPLYGDGERHEQFVEEDLPLVYIQDKCLGTYVHGILDNPAVIDYVVSPLAKRASEAPVMTAGEFKDRQYDLLAEHVRRYVDIDKIYEILAPPSPKGGGLRIRAVGN